MKARLVLAVCVGVVVVAAVLSAQALDPAYDSRIKAATDNATLFNVAMEAFNAARYAEAKAAAQKMQQTDPKDARAEYLVMASDFYMTGGYTESTATTGGGGTTTTTPTPGGPLVINLTDEEVEAVFNEYGAQRMTAFRNLQTSIFIPRCASDRCHGNPATSGRFYLKTADAASRKTQAENLKAVMQYVNNANLGGSRILSVTLAPREEHPGGPVFRSERDRPYQQLKQWVDNLPGLFGG